MTRKILMGAGLLFALLVGNIIAQCIPEYFSNKQARENGEPPPIMGKGVKHNGPVFLGIEKTLEQIVLSTKTPVQIDDTRLDSLTSDKTTLYYHLTITQPLPMEYRTPTFMKLLKEQSKLGSLEKVCSQPNRPLAIGATYSYEFSDMDGAALNSLFYTIRESDCLNIEAARERVEHARKADLAANTESGRKAK